MVFNNITSFVQEIPNVWTEITLSFIFSYSIVFIWNIYATGGVSLALGKGRKRKNWFIVLVLIVPVYFVVNATWQSGITGRFIFGSEYQNLPSYLLFFASVLTAYLLYKTLNLQRQENRLQHFENHFYELIHLHKQNVQEMNINGNERVMEINENTNFRIRSFRIENREVFASMYNELRYCFTLCQNTYEKMKLNDENKISTKMYSDIEILEIAYSFFWSGVGLTSDSLTRRLGSNYDKTLVNKFSDSLNEKYDGFNPLTPDETVIKDKNENKVTLEYLHFKPFSGHLTRLGHYYRHLFQSVKYIIENYENRLFDRKKAEGYLKTLRAQLSDYEQVMLYYNALSGYGNAWFDKDFFAEYRMIHNIPMDLAIFGCSPKDHPAFKKKFKKREPYTNSLGSCFFEADE